MDRVIHAFLREFLQKHFSFFNSADIPAGISVRISPGFRAGIYVPKFVHVFRQENFLSFSSADIPAGFSARISAGFRTRENRAVFLAHFSAFFVKKFMHIFCINDLRVLFSFFKPQFLM